MGKGFFVAGTRNDIGKTYVAGLLTKKLNRNGFKTTYYKATMNGGDEAETVKKMSGIMQDAADMCPYVYNSKQLPYQAARSARNQVEMEAVKAGFDKLIENNDCVIVEGEGGIVCPIRMDGGEIWQEDIINALDLSCVIVSNAAPEAVNNVVLTGEYMKAHDIPVKGVIYNNCHPGNMIEDDIIFMIERKTGLRTIAKVAADAQEIDIEISELALLFR